MTQPSNTDRLDGSTRTPPQTPTPTPIWDRTESRRPLDRKSPPFMDASQADNRFIIICAPRTGSTLLRRILDSLPGIICHGEIFSSDYVYGVSEKTNLHNSEERLSRKHRDHHPVDFLAALGLDDPAKRTGFKILYNDLLDPKTAIALSHLKADTGIRIIHLWRRDLVQRYVSECRLLAGYANAEQVAANKQTRIALTLDPQEFVTRSKNLISTASIIIDIFREHRIQTVAYEDLLRDNAKRVALLAFLGYFEPRGFSIPAERVSLKHPTIAIQIDNHEQIMQELQAASAFIPSPEWLPAD